MDVLHLVNTHDKLLAFDFFTLKPIPHIPIIFLARGDASRAETMSIVVGRDFKPNRFIKFDIDDGAVYILNQETSCHFSHRI
uniref:Putative ovule protein n=1 Tax=Solanum chacoense TaxID=4108 RepID=A0A0V0I4D8_SOLCH